MVTPSEVASPAVRYGGGRAPIERRSLRVDRWWVPLLTSIVVLTGFVAYATWAAFAHADYFWRPYISPFYSPCLAITCGSAGWRPVRRRPAATPCTS